MPPKPALHEVTSDGPKPVKVGLAVVTAIKSISAQQAALQAQLNEILTEAGLDMSVAWKIGPDGVATPQEAGD